MRTKSNHLDSNDCFIKNIKERKVDKIFIDKRLSRDVVPAFESYANFSQRKLFNSI